MASLALAAAFSAAGTAAFGTGTVVFGMTAGSIGWMVGGAIGGMLDQKAVHTRQPSIGDKSIQASTYG